MLSDYPIRIITPSSDEWPTGLHSLGDDMPARLYAIGQPLPQRPAVAIVGARAATRYGETVTGDLVAGLGQEVTIVSGAAYGIDGAAHRQAMAQGAPTVAYLASGVNRPYPAGHADLLARIAQVGTILSEYEPGSAPTRDRFLRRNRLIAAHGHVLVVVEAGIRSGSLNAARQAQEIGRPVGAVPGPLTSAASAGCHHLIREGAALIRDAQDVRDMVRPRVGQEG